MGAIVALALGYIGSGLGYEVSKGTMKPDLDSMKRAVLWPKTLFDKDQETPKKEPEE